MTDNRDGTGQADAASERPIFEALLTPYRSLGRRGFNILMAFVGGVSLVTGIAFVAKVPRARCELGLGGAGGCERV